MHNGVCVYTQHRKMTIQMYRETADHLELQRLKHSSQVPVMMPGAIMAFHWPRADLDQLLCIRYPAIVSLLAVPVLSTRLYTCLQGPVKENNSTTHLMLMWKALSSVIVNHLYTQQCNRSVIL